MKYTPKQLNIMEYIAKVNREKGYSPTYAEIAQVLGVSTPTIYEHICALEKKGALRRQRYEARSLEVLDPKFMPESEVAASQSLEVSGKVLSGGWVYVSERPQKVTIPMLLRVEKEAMLLEVVGDFLKDTGFSDGDILVIEKMKEAEPGHWVMIRSEDGRVLLRKYDEELAAGSASNVAVSRKVAVVGVVRTVVRRLS